MFSMAVGTIGEWLKLVLSFVRGLTVDWGGGGGGLAFLKKHLLFINPQPPPPPPPQNQMIALLILLSMSVSSVGFAWGVLRASLIEQTDALTMYNFYLRLGSTSIGHVRHVKTRNDFSQKLLFSVGKKMFQRQI